MKIVRLRIRPISQTLAFIYAAFGLLFCISFWLSGVEYMTLPVGVVGPLLHVNLNFNFQKSPVFSYNALLLLGSIVSYALTGWLTAAVAVTCFNIVAKLKGGINAGFIFLSRE
jgi:hypothetical protein